MTDITQNNDSKPVRRIVFDNPPLIADCQY